MSYRIKSGDTLGAIAKRFGTTVASLARANNIRNVNFIVAGKTLKIPGRSDSFSKTSSAKKKTPARSTSSSSKTYGPKAAKLANVARGVAQSMNTRGWCARGVANSLEKAGLRVPRQPSAYMYANVLSRDSRFKEIRVSNPRNLPPGAIIVHARGGGAHKVHGHIAISLGNGREASDHIQSMLVSRSYRVFVPKG